VAFQMQDDILDLTSKEFEKKKGGRGQDITEGKRTLAVIHTLKVAKTKEKKRLIEILNMHTSDQKLKDEAISIMERSDSIDYVRSFAKKIVKVSWKQVKSLLPCSAARTDLNDFARFLIERKI
jgi:geranylgeranyl pyrophosphate synthase